MSTKSSGTNNFKVVLLGEGCVGKTSILLRYIEDQFNDKHLSTLQATFLNKKLNINNKRINLSIWDTAGQERFHALGPIYYRHSHGAVLVYDITDDRSFAKVQNWVKELKKMLGSDIVLVIAGNKIDLEHERAVPIEEAERYAEVVGAKHFHTSAKLNQAVEELFLELSRLMLERSEQALSSPPRSSSMPRTLALADDDDAPVSGACCSSVHP